MAARPRRQTNAPRTARQGRRLDWPLRIIAIACVLYGLHRLGLHLEDRGWLHYTRASRRTRASLAIAAVFDPAARQVLELQEQEREEDADPGEDHDPDVRDV